MNIKDAINQEFKQCLDVRGEKYVLKQRNTYYDQVQLNMAVLNVKRASFTVRPLPCILGGYLKK